MAEKDIELTFLGSGNAFAPEGRAFSSFLLNRKYLFDCGPTVLQQLRKAEISSDEIEAIFITHFHADHFFGLPFVFLDAWHQQRTKPLIIVGPPSIQQKTEELLALGYGGLPGGMSYERCYVEVQDGMEAEVAGLRFSALQVEHVPDLESYGFRVQVGDRTLVYSGDVKLCRPLIALSTGADVLVLECSCAGETVHLRTRT